MTDQKIDHDNKINSTLIPKIWPFLCADFCAANAMYCGHKWYYSAGQVP